MEVVAGNDVDGVEKAVEADEEGFHSISNDWGVLFGGKDVTSKVKKLAIQGHLRGCCFRSVCWKLYPTFPPFHAHKVQIFLGVLPDDRSQWVTAMQAKRQEYAKVKQEYLEDPRSRASGADATFNNPLSLDEESPWNQFFQDEELRKIITQDVVRTHPDMEFFEQDRIQTLMCDVLFCYARAHKDIGYRQGIHELLAPIVFVLDSDKRDADNMPTNQSCADDMLVILSSDCLEADAYVLLDALMDTCSEWYEHGAPDVRPAGKKSPVGADDTKLFQNVEDANPSSAVVRKLERIQQVLIKKEDPELHSHLSKLAIPPQIFGLRWIRLLFAREFSLMDVLLLWDAIFAVGPTLELVDHIVLAMLLFIRDPLIAGTYLSVMQLLMNFPGVADVQYIIQRALFLNNPTLYPRPPNWQLQRSDASNTTLSAPVGLRPANRLTTVRSGVTHVTQGARSLAGKTASLFKKPESPAMTRKEPASTVRSSMAYSSSYSAVGRSPEAIRKAKKSPTGSATPASQPTSPILGSGDFTSATTRTEDRAQAAGSEKPLEAVELPAEERLSRWLDASNICGERMEFCLRALENQLVDIDIPKGVDDKVFLALAGLKQVRDLLRGTLGYSLSREDVESLLSMDIDPASPTRSLQSQGETREDGGEGPGPSEPVAATEAAAAATTTTDAADGDGS